MPAKTMPEFLSAGRYLELAFSGVIMLPITPKSRASLAISALLAVVFLAACATTQAPVISDVVNPVSVGVAPAF
ncbi:MAG TPA: hypothetical protein EYM65_01360, partial [Dehalococcoidia bacterium]|nr:hypothetical protein [Dehalococcoidia bacterium]